MEAIIALDERRRDAYVARAALSASLGEISDVEISHPRRVFFSYAPPARTQGTDETLDVRLELSDGGRVARNVGFHLDPPEAPVLTMHAQGDIGSEEGGGKGSIAVRAQAGDIAVLELAVSRGRLVTSVERTHEVIRAEAEVDLSTAMNESPRPLLAIATAVSPRGFSAESADLTRAFASRLGSSPVSQLAPQPSPAAGDVERFACFVVPIPGQAVADGGRGPTLVVALSAGSLGGPRVWPRLFVEGAKISGEIPLHDGLRAVAIDRPRTPGQMRILLDRTECGHVAFSAPHGDRPIVVELASAPGSPPGSPPGQRAAIEGTATLLSRSGVEERPDRAGASSQTSMSPDSNAGRWIAPHIAASAIAGASLSGLGFTGGGASLGVIFPSILQARLGLRAGVELLAHQSRGALLVRDPESIGRSTDAPPRELDVDVRILDLEIPAEVTFFLVRPPGFSLSLHAGGAMRFVEVALHSAGDTLTRGSKLDLVGRVGVEASVEMGFLDAFLGASLDGLGPGLRIKGEQADLKGSLLSIRGTFGVRVSP